MIYLLACVSLIEKEDYVGKLDTKNPSYVPRTNPQEAAWREPWILFSSGAKRTGGTAREEPKHNQAKEGKSCIFLVLSFAYGMIQCKLPIHTGTDVCSVLLHLSMDPEQYKKLMDQILVLREKVYVYVWTK